MLSELGSSREGISPFDGRERLGRFGPNRLEPPPPPPWWRLFVRQFADPLIYILVAAAVVALLLDEYSDAGFIGAVLLVNAIIGFVNEAKAERKVRSLAGLVRTRARVRRDGQTVEIDGEEVVPGDVVLLESGARVSADLRVLEANGLRVDEALLTGESGPVHKEPDTLAVGTPLAERTNMAFAGTLAVSGRGVGVAVATGTNTEVGEIARQMAAVTPQPPPLILRMRRFARVVGAVVLGISGFIVLIGALRAQPLTEVLLGAMALAVSAVPEGLPIALTVALAVAVSRMAGRGVVVRHLPAVEGLGSCGVIATDKTGTLTRNELTVEKVLAGGTEHRVTGVGYEPSGRVLTNGGSAVVAEHPALHRLLRAATLANEASLVRREDEEPEWAWSGDPTDVALLSLAYKAGLDPSDHRLAGEELGVLPFEPERRYAAAFHAREDGVLVSVKGAPERVLEMCETMIRDEDGRVVPLRADRLMEEVRSLMEDGYRVIAVADRELPSPVPERGHPPPEPSDLVFLGVVGMTDPPREGVEDAVARCRRAGVRVVMVTGDHGITASAIAARIGLVQESGAVVEGGEIAGMDDDTLVRVMATHAVVARATPTDKLRVVEALQRRGAYVAVTGDGVNDAPALQQANLGVAMGQSGTDVAREAADLIITDDDFTSIVAGVEEGRIAYDNVRKVTYLLVSTGAGEVLLVLAALLAALPVPFTAVQLLWLNLVTNGIQDVALAFEPGEPGVLDRPPRPPRERIFDGVMIERTLLAGLTFAGLGLACWIWWLEAGRDVAEARNLLVQLFVLFEVFHIGNARSESISLFRLSPLRNPVLLLGTFGALSVHLAAMHTPFFQGVLGVAPIPLADWVLLAAVAAGIVVVMELHKAVRGPSLRGKERVS